MERAQAEAQQFAEDDKIKKERIETKNRLDAMGYQIEKFLTEANEKAGANPEHALSEEDKTKLQGLADESKRLKDDENASKEDMEAVMKDIETTLNAMYQKYG